MAIISMTGFSRVEGGEAGLAWYWETRSVNGRGLDLRFRLPPGFETLETAAREAVGKRFSRGSVSVSLSVRREASALELRLNEAVLDRVIDAARRIQGLTGGDAIRPDGILGFKGVLEAVEPADDPVMQVAIREAMLQGLSRALDELAAARADEGRRLREALDRQIGEIARLVAGIEAAPARRPEAIRSRLSEQIARILDSANGFDPARLHQEAVLIATRADVEEEIERLKGHVLAAKDLIAAPGAIGRKLDFLAQEFNREANTICAKSNDGAITRAGLDLKVVIDQLREQVQNIE